MPTKKTSKKQTITKQTRPSWDEYFLDIMKMVGTRSTCDRGRSGAVIVRDRRMLSSGYVGSPIGVAHCDDAGHEMHTVIGHDNAQSRHCIRTTHAEQNAIVSAARVGVKLDGSTLYVHMTPCYICAKMIVNAGIVRIVSANDYHAGARSKKLFKEAKIKFELLDKMVQKYDDM